MCTRAKSLQLCPTLCNSTDCSLPDFSIHGVSQARILEWVSMSFSRGLPDLGIKLTCIGRRVLYHQRHLGSSGLGPLVLYSRSSHYPSTHYTRTWDTRLCRKANILQLKKKKSPLSLPLSLNYPSLKHPSPNTLVSISAIKDLRSDSRQLSETRGICHF